MSVGGNGTLNWDNTVTTNPKDITLPNWDVTLEKNDDLVFHDALGRPANGIGMTFTLKRMMTYHLMQTFLPSAMIMIASVLSVFVPSRHVPGRVTLCITAFLAMISLINGARYFTDTNIFKFITRLYSTDFFTLFGKLF